MSNSVRFCLALHNHQPVGNFDFVFEQAYQDSYRPFLEVFADYPELKISLHTSGPLMEWLDVHHPEYLDRLAEFVAAGRVEIVGGAFFEPILTMIPREDRVGQITRFSRWLQERLGAQIHGMWIAERVWEQYLTSDLVEAGIKYTLLDDFHFKNAGLNPDQLHGYYLTEDDGNLLSVFPGSETMRYLIPFADPQQTVDYLRTVAERAPGSVVVFGDDGEKFGTWPDTKQHVYEYGWLRRFFDLLMSQREWLHTTTLSEAFFNTPPLGKVYLPEGSYREMTEWALPVDQQLNLEHLKHDFSNDPRWQEAQRFVRGGFWRNFKTRYTEADEMYARMMMVSRRLEELAASGDPNMIDAARTHLYRGQCNCAYWHGAFGGIYLPHLRNAIYQQLIIADNYLDEAAGKPHDWVEGTVEDYDLDARQEVRLANRHLIALVDPARGGQLYELDLRSIGHNLLATMQRRPEAYHQKVAAGSNPGDDNVASIHERVVFKQENLDQHLQYDLAPRKSLIDRFLPQDVQLGDVVAGRVAELGDFHDGAYEARLRRNPDRVQLVLTRGGTVAGQAIRLTKGITITADSSTLEIAYLLEGLAPDQPMHFAVEWNFSGLPAGQGDRYFYGENRQSIGHLGSQLDLRDASELGLVDEWLGVDIQLQADRAMHLWTYPIATVSQSEGGFELVHQSVVVQPHWIVAGDASGRWSTRMTLRLNSKKANQPFGVGHADANAPHTLGAHAS